MANEKVSQLIELATTEVAPDDLFFIADVSTHESKKFSATSLITFINASASVNAYHADQADSASYVDGPDVGGSVPLADLASLADTASYSLQGLMTDTASLALTSSYSAFCAIGVTSADTASFLLYSGVANGTSSYSLNSLAAINALSASTLIYIPGTSKTTASYAVLAGISRSSSFASSSISASFATSASYARSASISDTSSFSNLAAQSLTSSFLLGGVTNLVNRVYTVANPEGTISSGSTQFIWQYNVNSTLTYLSKVNNTNNSVTYITNSISNENWTNPHFVTSGTGINYLTWVADSSIWLYNLSTLAISRFATGVINVNYKVVIVDDVTYGTPTLPAFYIMGDAGGLTSAIPLYRVRYVAGWTLTLIGTSLSLISNTFINDTEFKKLEPVNSTLLCFIYNPIKKRFYLMTNGSSYLHIMNINTYPYTLDMWWVDAGRYSSYLTYEKTITMLGNDAYWSNANSEHISLEYDLVTGQEYALSVSRRGTTSYNGSVIKVPWFEG